MAAHLYLAPAGHGKTAYVLARIRQTRAGNPLTPITVILPNQVQVSAFRQRLSAGRGALGVNLGTFYTLYADILARAGKLEPRLPEPVQYRLIRSIVVQLIDAGRLPYYAPLRDKPGFVVVLRALLEELKRARIHRDQFKQAVETLSDRGPRLTELAEIYTAYQNWLYANNWADTEGQGWLAALALERQPNLVQHLRLLIVDGFDEFNPTQLTVLKLLSQRATETIITLTGEQARWKGGDVAGRKKSKTCREGERSRSIENLKSEIGRLRRFTRALQAVSQTLHLEPESLPETPTTPPSPALAYLEANLFISEDKSVSVAGEAVTFIEAQNRAEEARAALRWLKARLVRDLMAPPEIALIARDLRLYRPSIEETAVEFGLTLHWREGLNLAANPVIAALMSLLALPVEDDAPDHNWSRRPVIDAWRSPYFENLAPEMTPGHADHLDAVARQGLVMQGLGQWRAALAQLVEQAAHRADEPPSPSPLIDEALPRPDHLTLPEARTLKSAFESFVARITPPPQVALRQYAAFVEDLIGDDPKLIKDEGRRQKDEAVAQSNRKSEIENRKSLGVVNRAWAVPTTAPRDIAALRAFKDVLRGLVLAEASLRQSAFGESDGETADAPTIAYAQFCEELQGAVQGATYYLPPPEQPDAAVPVLSVLNARGLSFRAVALLGLAEGEFPRREQEDILLREEDRRALQRAGLTALETRLHGDEITLFYQAATRAREKLLLCRPYLADDGQKWEPSPYWEEAHRLVGGAIEHIRPEDPLPLSEVASLQELARSGALSRYDLADLGEEAWLLPTDAAARLLHSAAILQTRLAAEPQGPFEGDLSNLAEQFSTAYGPDHVWSSSRLEAYGLCPLHFWLGQDLALETRQPPEEGFDVFSLGSMYHEILEDVYRQVEGGEADSERLLALLPPIAKEVFDKAPKTYGFRPTPLWEMQRRELEQIMAQTLEALAEATAGSTPLAQEQVFGLDDQPPLLVRRDDDEFRVRGYIDRVDQDPDGRLRIIDYKSGSAPIAARDLSEGRRLQIALYALAARDALNRDIADGFYWHIGSAKTSSLQLGRFAGGVEGALNAAITHAFNHIAGARAGQFTPSPPSAGCPGHCPGASFCWRYKAKGW